MEITYKEKKNSISINDLYSLGLIGQDISVKKREYLASVLHIGNPNGKTLLKRLNYMGIEFEELKVILNEKNWDSK